MISLEIGWMQLLPKNVSDGAVKFLEGSIHILTKVDHITWCGYTVRSVNVTILGSNSDNQTDSSPLV